MNKQMIGKRKNEGDSEAREETEEARSEGGKRQMFE